MELNGKTFHVELEDGTVKDMNVLHLFSIGAVQYIALVDDIDDEEGTILVYRLAQAEDGGSYLDNITDEEEFESVLDRVEEYLESME